MILETRLLAAAILLIICVVASKAFGKLGFPTLVVFLAVGFLAGSEGLGKIEFDDALATQSLGIIALVYILFSGGLDTKWSQVRPVLREGIILSTLGVMFTCFLMGAFIHYVLKLPLMESFLIGAIVSSTDAGAVFNVLRSKNVHLRGHLKPLLELESGSNDPMAVFLTTTIIQMMQTPEFSLFEMIPLLFKQMVIGGMMGFISGISLVYLFNKLKLSFEGLYLVLSIGVVLLIYSLTQKIEGNGFLAVYMAGVVLGNHKFVFKKSLMVMHDGLSWLMQCVMFLTLGLLVYPSNMIKVAIPGIMIAAFMILIARPVAVFLSLIPSKMKLREKSLVSWVGLRGSVPVVMATYPLVAGLDKTGLIFNLVFFIAITSLVFQGTSIPFVSKLLKVHNPYEPEKKNYSSTPGHLSEIVTVDIPYNSPVLGHTIVDLALPEDKVLIIGIERNNEVIIPRGSTIFEPGDKVSVMANDDYLELFVEKIWGNQDEHHSVFHHDKISDESKNFHL